MAKIFVNLIFVLLILQQNIIIVVSKMNIVQSEQIKQGFSYSNWLGQREAQQKNKKIARLQIPINRIEQQIYLYRWRSEHFQTLVHCHWETIRPIDENLVQFMLTHDQKLQNLVNISSLPKFNDSQKIIKILKSFIILYKKFGPFLIDPEMIFFDQNGEPYVWMNTNFYKNEYKRLMVSSVDFARLSIQILLNYKQKICGPELQIMLSKLILLNYKLQEMVSYIQNASNFFILSPAKEKQLPEKQQGSPCILNFSQNRKKKKSRVNKQAILQSANLNRQNDKDFDFPTKLMRSNSKQILFFSKKEYPSELQDQQIQNKFNFIKDVNQSVCFNSQIMIKSRNSSINGEFQCYKNQIFISTFPSSDMKELTNQPMIYFSNFENQKESSFDMTKSLIEQLNF